MNKLLILSALVTFGILFISCGDDDTMEADTMAPVVTFNSPSNGTTVFAGDTILFSVTAVDNVSLSTMTLSGTLGLTQDFTTFDSPTNHTEDFNVIIDTLTPSGLYDVNMTATDAAGNTGVRSIDLTVVE